MNSVPAEDMAAEEPATIGKPPISLDRTNEVRSKMPTR